MVRPGTVADVEAIAELETAAFPLDPWSPNLLEHAVAGSLPTVTLLVADGPSGPSSPSSPGSPGSPGNPGSPGSLAGYAVVSVVDVDAELQRIAVPEPLRRQGVARSLLGAVRAHAAALGAQRLLLEVREDNIAAQAFYARNGFAELGRRPRYYRDGAAALVLWAPVTMSS